MSQYVETTDQFDDLDITPEQAIPTIEEAITLGTDVANYSANKDQFTQDLKYSKTPEKLHPKLSEFAGFSKEQAALVYGDAPLLNKLGKAYDGYKAAPKMQRLTDLTMRKFAGQQLNQAESDELFELNLELNSSEDDDSIDMLSTEIGKQVGLLKGMVERNHKAIINTGAASAALGAGLGFAIGNVPGAIIVGKGAFLTGTSTAATVAFGVENIKLNTALTYNAIEDIELNEDRTIDETTKKQIAAGAGLLMGGIETVIGRYAARSIPGLRNFVGNKQFIKRIVSDPTLAATSTAIRELGEAFTVQGAGEGSQEAIQVLAEEFGRANGDWTEANFLNAIKNSADRIRQATIMGGAVGTTFQAPFSGINFLVEQRNNIKAGTPEAQRVEAGDIKGLDTMDVVREKLGQAKRAIEFQDRIASIAAISDATKTGQMSETAMNMIHKQFIEDTDLKYLTMDLDDLADLRLPEEKYARVRQLLKLDDIINKEAPVQVSTIDFLNSAKDAPELYDIIRENETSLNAKKAREFVENLEKVDKEVVKLKEKLGESGEAMSPIEVDKYIGKIVNRSGDDNTTQYDDVTDNVSYFQSPVVPKEVEASLPEGEFTKIQSARRQARLARAQTIENKLTEDYNRIRDAAEIDQMELQKEEEYNQLINHPGLELVAKFNPETERKNVFVGDRIVDDPKASHQEKGYSALAIDPRGPDGKTRSDLKDYVKNKNIKSHKVFVKGGLPPEVATRELGFKNAKQMLDMLSTTPTRDELATAKAERHRDKIRSGIEQDVKPDEAEISEAYNKVAKNHLEELDFMLKQKWSATKLEIARLVKGIPTLDSMTYEAKQAILGMKLREMTPKMFEVAERKADRKSVNYWTKGDLFNAFDQKLNAAKAVLLDKEMKLYKARVNRAIRFLKKVQQDPEYRDILKRAGSSYYNAADHLLSLMNLRPESNKAAATREAFQDFVRKMIKQGKGDFTLPDRVLDPRVNIRDFTVDEVLQITDRVRNIVHLAEFKNQLVNKKKAKDLATYIEDVANNTVKQLSGLPAFDLQKLKESQIDAKNASMLRNTRVLLNRIEFVFQRMDRGEINGYMHRTFFQPLVDAGNGKAVDIQAVFKKLEELQKNYGDDFKTIGRDKISIPEFNDAKGFYGEATKAQLIQLAMNMGNEGNIKAAENFGVNRDTIMQVLNKHLTTKDMDYVQGVWDIIESLKPKVAELEIKTNGIEPDWVEAKPFIFKDKAYRGGYYRIMYNGEMNFEAIQDKLIGAGERATLEEMAQRKHYAQAMTKQYHLTERVGSDKMLDLSLGNTNQILEEILHDIHYRAPVRDVATLLADTRIADAITAATSKEQYNAIAQWVVDAANSNLDPVTSKEESKVMRLIGRISGAQNVVYLGARLSVAFSQLASVFTAPLKMGPEGGKYLLMSLAKTSGNPSEFLNMVDFVADRFPDLKLTLENLDLSAKHSFDKYLPSEKTGKISNFTDTYARILRDRSFMLIGYMDMYVRVITWQAAYLQALNGEAKGISMGDEKAAINYAGSVTRTTQTANNTIDKSPVQKIKWFNDLFGKFFSQLNIVGNLIYNGWDDFKDSRIIAKEMLDYGEGSAESVRSAFKAEAKGLGSLAVHVMLAGVLPTIFINMVKGEPLPGEDGSEDDWMTYLGKESAKSFLSTIPIVREGAWVAFGKGDYTRSAGIPLTRTITDAADASKAIYELALAYRKGQSPDEMTDKEKRALMNSIGIATGGLPTEALYQIFKVLDDVDWQQYNMNQIKDTSDKIKTLLKSDTSDLPPQIVEALKESLETLDPDAAAEVEVQVEAEQNGIDETYYEIIKQQESKGDKFAKNPNSSAAGLYQFTEGTWNWIMEAAPELELTARGRYNTDTSQQEKAIKWFTEYNMNKLKAADIEITPENLYAAHFLGVSAAIKVLSTPNNYKLSTLVGVDTMKSNKHLKPSWKVKDFKEWLTEVIESNKPKEDLTKQVNN